MRTDLDSAKSLPGVLGMGVDRFGALLYGIGEAAGYLAVPPSSGTRASRCRLMNNWSPSWTSGAEPKSMTCWRVDNPYLPCAVSGN
jgi:hypothetical protein